jgi:hypothetical protein
MAFSSHFIFIYKLKKPVLQPHAGVFGKAAGISTGYRFAEF